MQFGVIANLNRPGAIDALKSVSDWTRQTGHTLVLVDDLKDKLSDEYEFAPRQELANRVDMLVSMGGDGTLLASARAVGKTETPLLGINLGSLGFLTQQEVGSLIPALESVAGGDYTTDRRMVLKVSVEGNGKLSNPYALNDVVLDRGSVSRVIGIKLSANGEKVVEYYADGLIIATPTGSTAYSLAVGGPIVHPNLEAMISSPISAFSLTARPMIFSADDRLDLQISTDGREAVLTLDGQVMAPLADHQTVSIVKADFHVHLVRLPDNSYYELLRRKLNWGIRPSP